MKQVIGVLGGLGPDTTSEFYLELVRSVGEKEAYLSDTIMRPAVCIWSLPLDLRKEQEYISRSRHQEYYLQLMQDGARRLERAGSGRIVIPCNTVHEFHQQVSEVVGIPVTNLIEVVAQEVENRNWEKVLLLATSRTLQAGLYQRALDGLHIDLKMPQAKDQQQLDLLIQGLLGQKELKVHQDFLVRLTDQAGTSRVILGCTDLQLLFSAGDYVIDSMNALVQHTATRC